jgi:hypothetical protein
MHGKLSVILVTAGAGETDGKLEFEPDRAHVLNIGASSEAIFILDPTSEIDAVASEQSPGAAGYPPGDQDFLRDLHQLALIGEIPDELRGLGEQLLAAVRQEFPGELEHRGRRYVESPDNFWTVECQTRVKDLQLTVRGVKGNFGYFVVPDGIELKASGREPYFIFKIWRSDQIPGALSIIQQARRKRRRVTTGA